MTFTSCEAVEAIAVPSFAVALMVSVYEPGGRVPSTVTIPVLESIVNASVSLLRLYVTLVWEVMNPSDAWIVIALGTLTR